MARITIHCERCMLGFDVKFQPCYDLEVIKHVACPNCSQEHTITITVAVQAEDWATSTVTEESRISMGGDHART